jgi:hypothetical protein
MPPRKRIFATTLLGAFIAIAGVVFFLSADAIATSSNSVQLPNGNGSSMNPSDRDRDEVLWSVFGFILILSGTAVAAVGLHSWCQSDRI